MNKTSGTYEHGGRINGLDHLAFRMVFPLALVTFSIGLLDTFATQKTPVHASGLLFSFI